MNDDTAKVEGVARAPHLKQQQQEEEDVSSATSTSVTTNMSSMIDLSHNGSSKTTQENLQDNEAECASLKICSDENDSEKDSEEGDSEEGENDDDSNDD